MGGGGKGGGNSAATVAPQYTDPVNGMSFVDSTPGDITTYNGQQYLTGAEALNAEIANRTATDTANTNASNANIGAENTANQATFLQQAQSAKDTARQSINDYFWNQGIDPTQYDTQIANTLDAEAGNLVNPGAMQAGVGNSTPITTTTANGTSTTGPTPATLIDYSGNPSSVYTATAGSDLFNQLQSGQQSRNLQAYNSLFAPSYSQSALSSDMVDPAVSSVLGQQFDPLSTELSNAQKRGSLNDVGYQAALTALNNDKTGANATVSKLAQGVLSGDQSSLDAYIGTGRTAAGSTPLGTSFDSSPYVTGAQNMAKQDTSNFGGDVQNAVGATSFGDINSLLTAGGLVQGANDPTASNPTGAAGPTGAAIGGGDLSPTYIAQQAIANQPRGLGTQGAF